MVGEHRGNRNSEDESDRYHIQFEDVLELANLAIWEYDIKDNHYLFNDRFYTMLGTSNLDQGGYRMSAEYYFENFVHPDDIERVVDEMNRSFESKGSTFEHRIIRADGEVRDVYVTVKMVKSSDKRNNMVYGTIQDITERKNIENELKESEEKFREVFNNANDAMFLHKVKDRTPGNFIEVNETACQILGYKRAELRGMGPWDIDYLDSVVENVMENLFKIGKTTFETIHITKNGELRPVEINAHLFTIRDENYILSIARDIRKRKKTEKALQRSERSYRDLVDNSSVGIFKTNINGDMLFINDAMAKIFHYEDAEDLKQHNILKIYKRPDDRFRLIKKLQDDGKVTDFGLETVGKNGEKVYVMISATLADGILSGMFMDITDRKNAEDALRNSEEQLRVVFNSVEDQIFIKDRNLKYVRVNSSLEKYFGIKNEDIIGKTDGEILDAAEMADTEIVDSKVLHGEIIKEELSPLNGADAILEIVKSPMYNDDGHITGLCGIARDITYRKKTEDALIISEALYRTIFENTGAATLIFDRDGLINMVNSEMELISGYNRDEIEGKIKWTEFVHSDEYEKMMDYHKKRRKDPESAPSQYETKFINRNGELICAQITVDEIPGLGQYISSIVDITQQKKQNEDLKWELEVNQALNKLHAPLVSQETSLEDISAIILSESLKLTESSFGYVGEINPKSQDMVLLSIVPHSHGMSQAVLKLDNNDKYVGLMGHSLNTKKGFFTNDVPSHPTYETAKPQQDFMDVNNFLSVPVILKGELVGQISISNSSRDYSEKDLEAVLRLTHFYTMAIQKVRAEKQIKKSLREKEVLLREIHHRVKNNMQIISSLLNIQIQYENLDETIEVLKESQGRVKSMSIIHEKLYQSSSLTNINFKDYVENLVLDIFYSYGLVTSPIESVMEIEDISLNIDTAIPLGLIINELVTNSVKYAFPSDEGQIKIKLVSKQDQLILTIEDNGIGISEDIDIENSKTLGLKLVHTLTDQLEGKLELKADNGTQFNLFFRELDYKKRI